MIKNLLCVLSPLCLLWTVGNVCAENATDSEMQRSGQGEAVSVADKTFENTFGMKMIWVAAGEIPAIRNKSVEEFSSITVDRGYYLAATEVTQAQWLKLMNDNPSRFKGMDLPVEQITWEDAMTYCRRLTEHEKMAGRLPHGYGYTLPTEMQWEYACRAGTTSSHAGELKEMAWYGINADKRPHPVATKLPNAWGFYDMHGNVWEWCLDWYTNEITPEGHLRIRRGGSWWTDASLCRSSFRSQYAPRGYNQTLGFRVALSETP